MRNIPDDNLSYPVLIKLDNGSSGTGFLINTPENIIYLVTARHVLFKDNKLLSSHAELICQPSNVSDNSKHRYSLDLTSLVSKYHHDADVAIVKIGEYKEAKFVVLTGVLELEVGKSSLVIVHYLSTKLLNEVLISNDVFVYGYPTSLGLRESAQFDYSKPLLRKGIIANVNAFQGTIILDCPVYFGNSGGPVVEVEQTMNGYVHKVIGVVSQFIPYIQEWIDPRNKIKNVEHLNSGYSVACSMDRVFELFEK